jgi:hypothetical protein
MKNTLLTISLLILCDITFSQVNAVVIDNETKEGIPFVNIWIENKNIGTTSNKNGEFTIDYKVDTENVIFSAIGYESKNIKLGLINNIVELNPIYFEIQEVVIKPEKYNKELRIGAFKKSNINWYFACGTSPWITARYFEYKDNYKQTAFLNKIKLLTNSDIKGSMFNIRLYSVDENGKPCDYIYDKNILVTARKGKKVTEVDISELKIKFPKEGFFIAIEWLIIESNKYEYTYTMNNSKKKLLGISYEPSIGTIPSETDANSWIYRKGEWGKVWKNDGPIKKYSEKYNLLAIELILTN